MFILSLYILFKAIKKYNLQGSCELLFRPNIKLNARQKKNGNIGSLPHALFRKTCYRGEDLASTSILGEFLYSRLHRTCITIKSISLYSTVPARFCKFNKNKLNKISILSTPPYLHESTTINARIHYY